MRPGRDARAGKGVPGPHDEGWRGSESERITNSGGPYPGT
jgi:hypothetical protein